MSSEGKTQQLEGWAGPTLELRKIRVEILGGPDAGNAVELPGPEARIGSGPECDLTLSDRAVSRLHLSLRVADSGVRVIDAGSSNGTYVDGLRVIDAFARPDSTIRVGESVLRLDLMSGTVQVPLSERERFGALLGRSVPMRCLFAVLERVAATETTVLIEGETGTGKELIAEAIHQGSRRAERPFVVFDCSAVSSSLIASELFGHVKGAFTGAVSDRAGAFEAADGGTLFLDEIGELPVDLQPTLLRALERLEVSPVGTHERRRFDVRVLAATNRSLSGEVEAGRFREDLYYRLAVVHVQAPPLRERPDDIPLLIEHFTRQFAERHGTEAELPPATVDMFRRQAWPGNVRELRNAVARALSIGPPRPRADDEPAANRGAPPIDLEIPFMTARDQLLDDFERAYVAAALEAAGGNVTRAADLAGVSRKFIYRVIQRHNLRGGD